MLASLTTSSLARRTLLGRPALRTSFSCRRRLHGAVEPLRILFCGSDDFSCAALKALHDEHVKTPSLIKSIDVVVRPSKPTGRGLKTLREVPLRSLASKLQLPIHERDTFTGWDMPRPGNEPINLIIAVSFGLFVPPRLLEAARYGGLNLHPSLLPDLRGPAPLHHTLLADRAHTGVTLQTLDPSRFDHGRVLAQTPSPGIPVPRGADVPALQALVTPPAAAMLVRGLRAGLHVPPLRDLGRCRVGDDDDHPPRRAPKITPRDRQVLWARWAAADVARRARVLGSVWTRALARDGAVKRVIFEHVEEAALRDVPAGALAWVRAARGRGMASGGGEGGGDPQAVTWLVETEPGAGKKRAEVSMQEVQLPYFPDGDAVVVPLPHLGCVRIRTIKVEGDKTRPAVQAIEQFRVRQEDISLGELLLNDFLQLSNGLWESIDLP